MYCRKCGKEMRNTSRFCPYCGCKVPEDTEPGSGQAEHIAAGKGKRQKESGEKYSLKLFSSKIMIVFLVIIVIAGFGGGRLFGKYQGGKSKKESQISKSSEDEKRNSVEKKENSVEEKEFIFEESDARVLTLEELENLNKELLAYAEKEILARHGYMFDEEEYKEYFGQKEWYQESVEGEAFDKFSVLNDFEKHNLNNIMFLENKSVEFEEIAGTYSVYVSQLGTYLYRFIYPDGININYYAVDNTGYLYSEYMEKKGDGIIINAHGDTYSENDYVTVTDTGIVVGGYTYKKESDQIVSTGEFGVDNNTLTVFDDGTGALGDTKGGWWMGEDAYDMDLGLYTADYAHHTKYFTYNDCLFSCAVYDIKEQQDMQVGVYECRGDEISGLESHNEKDQFFTILTVPSHYLSTEKQRAAL